MDLEKVEGSITSLDDYYKTVIGALNERVETDPSISLEVNNIVQYLDKPARYKRYFQYMTLITQLESARYQALSDLHAVRAVLLEPLAQPVSPL